MPVLTRKSAPLVLAAVTGAALILPARTLFPDCGPHRGFLDRDPIELRVLVAVQNAPLLRELAAEEFLATRPQVDGRCVVVHVDGAASGEAEGNLARGWPASEGPRPDVWMPLTRTWVDLLRREAGHLVPDEVHSINTTPEVVAMPEPMAAALGWSREVGWSGKRIGWKQIYELAQNPEGWKSKGHEEWGRFWLARTNPNNSTSGLYSTVAAYHAAKRNAGLPRPLELSSGDLTHPRIVEFVKGVESSVLFYGDTSLSILSQLYAATRRDEALEFMSAVTVAETSVVNYNLGYAQGEAGGKKRPAPKVKLVALYPQEGTLFAEQVYVMLNWLTGQKRLAAEKLLRFLQSKGSQKSFQEHGFRNPDGVGGKVLRDDPGVTDDARVVPRLDPPDPEVVQAVRDSWAKLRKRVRMLIVVDLSVSRSWLDRVQDAVEESLKTNFDPEDEMGLWATSAGNSAHVEIAPLAPIGLQLTALLSKGPWQLGPPEAPLYFSLQEAIGRFGDVNRINGIVFLTDGRHQESGLNSLLGDLDDARRRLGLRVFPIGLGEKVDCDALRRIAETSRTDAYCVAKPAKFQDVFTRVVESF